MFSMNSLHGPGAAVPDGFHQEQRLRFSSCRTVLDSVQELQEFRRQQNRKLRKTASQNSQCSSSKCLSQFLDLPHHHFIPPFPHSRSKPWEMHCRHIKRFRLNIRIWFFFHGKWGKSLEQTAQGSGGITTPGNVPERVDMALEVVMLDMVAALG